MSDAAKPEAIHRAVGAAASGWYLSYEGFHPEHEGLREALCTVGNGYFATRGAAPEARDDGVHYPGTYVAGGYNRLTTPVAGRDVENEDLVNFPHWPALDYRIPGEPWMGDSDCARLDYRQVLDMRRGLLERSYRCRDANGRVLRVQQRMLVHMRHAHLAALEVRLTPENWSGRFEIRSALDGRIANNGVARYRAFDGQHLEVLEAKALEAQGCVLRVRTLQSRLELAMAARTQLHRNGERLDVVPRCGEEPERVTSDFELTLEQGQTLRIEKVVAIYTSRDRAISECGAAAIAAIRTAPGFDELQASQRIVWDQLWQRFDIGEPEIDAPTARHTLLALRLHIFHLLQTVSLNTIDIDAGVPARGWHGEAYRGHVFWDELFIFPLLNLRLPEVTRALLMYRYRRLDAARANARAAGLRGAMYPWQSGSSGREESQFVHLNPMSGHWLPDHTYLQRHVNAAIAFNVWSYFQVTHDLEFLGFYGAEMILELARFWASMATLNTELERYEIHGVVGPDEFHTGLPGAERPGLSNHTYTNVMAVWVLCRGLEVLKLLPEERERELRDQLDLDDRELARWDDISRRMRLVFHADGIPSQFDGYEALDELDWGDYRRRYGDIHRLDRILEAEGDSVNRYKAAKQADVLMLLYLFSSEELSELFERMGYPFAPDLITRTVAYYASRTTHGSTLSRVVDSWVLARSDREGSWNLFCEALGSDLDDLQGGTTPEGIHLGAMAGTVDALQRGYTGIETRADVLRVNPRLPAEVKRLSMTIRYRGHAIELDLTPTSLGVRTRDHARAATAAPIRIVVRDEQCEMGAGEARDFALPPG